MLNLFAPLFLCHCSMQTHVGPRNGPAMSASLLITLTYCLTLNANKKGKIKWQSISDASPPLTTGALQHLIEPNASITASARQCLSYCPCPACFLSGSLCAPLRLISDSSPVPHCFELIWSKITRLCVSATTFHELMCISDRIFRVRLSWLLRAGVEGAMHLVMGDVQCRPIAKNN